MKKIIILLLVCNIAFSQEEDSISTFEPILNYYGDGARNIAGGIKTGFGYNGFADAGFIIHTDKWWGKGEFCLELGNTHGYGITDNLVGDLQYLSWLENGNYTFLYQAFYKQGFKNAFIKFGVHDMTAEFAASNYSDAFTGSSIYLPSTFMLNMPISFYPNNSIGFMGAYNISEKLTLQAGVYNGDPKEFDGGDSYNLKHQLNSDNDLFTIAECNYILPFEKEASIKAGFYLSTLDNPEIKDSIEIINNNYGLYAVYDMLLWENGDRKLGGFLQLGVCPTKAAYNPFYAGAGINLNGLINNRADDCLALGAAYARLFDDTYECDIECNYNIAINDYINVKPTLHYIINPGANAGYDNAFVALVSLWIGL